MSVLFTFLKKANDGDLDYVDTLTDEEMKTISPFILNGWVIGASSDNAARTILTDQFLNSKTFSLYKHPRLLLKLFVSANAGFGNCRFAYKKPRSKSGVKKSEVDAIMWAAGCTNKEAVAYMRILSPEAIKHYETSFKMME